MTAIWKEQKYKWGEWNFHALRLADGTICVLLSKPNNYWIDGQLIRGRPLSYKFDINACDVEFVRTQKIPNQRIFLTDNIRVVRMEIFTREAEASMVKVLIRAPYEDMFVAIDFDLFEITEKPRTESVVDTTKPKDNKSVIDTYPNDDELAIMIAPRVNSIKTCV